MKPATRATIAWILVSTTPVIPQEFRLSTRLVMVPVTVTDPHGSLVNGLNRQAFRIVEEHQAQPIVSFNESDVPCSMAVVFDSSGSMDAHLTGAKRALRMLFDKAEPADEALLVGVGDRPMLRSPLTADLNALTAGLAFEHAHGDTALYDSIAFAFEQIKQARNPRKALIVISDGVDNQSRLTRAALMRQAFEADVEVHTIVVSETRPSKTALVELSEEQNGAAFLNDLSKATGGLSFVIRDDAAMREAAVRIGKALRSQYVIGFRPVGDHDGKHHAMQVRVAIPGTHVHSRRAYLSD